MINNEAEGKHEHGHSHEHEHGPGCNHDHEPTKGDVARSGGSKIFRLNKIIEDLRERLPVNAEAPSEQITIPSSDEVRSAGFFFLLFVVVVVLVLIWKSWVSQWS